MITSASLGFISHKRYCVDFSQLSSPTLAHGRRHATRIKQVLRTSFMLLELLIKFYSSCRFPPRFALHKHLLKLRGGPVAIDNRSVVSSLIRLARSWCLAILVVHRKEGWKKLIEHLLFLLAASLVSFLLMVSFWWRFTFKRTFSTAVIRVCLSVCLFVVCLFVCLLLFLAGFKNLQHLFAASWIDLVAWNSFLWSSRVINC